MLISANRGWAADFRCHSTAGPVKFRCRPALPKGTCPLIRREFLTIGRALLRLKPDFSLSGRECARVGATPTRRRAGFDSLPGCASIAGRVRVG